MLFSGNRAVAGGGAIYNLASSPTLINVTIASNAAGGSLGTVTTAVAPFGGGMFNFTGSKPVLRNTIIWNNADSSGIGTPSASMRNLDAASTPAADNSDIQGLAGIPGLIFDNTSIDQNPLFVAPLSPATAPNFAGDRRLQSGSPAIDSGDNSFNSLPTDLGQQPRIQDGSGDGSAIIDMGAFEAPKLLAPRVQLAIAANPSTANLGAIITFTYVVTNSGNVTSSIVAGDDTTGPVVFNQDNVPPGAVLAASRQYTVTALDLPLLVNTFYAIAIAPNGSMAQGSTAAVVNLQVSDQMAVTKTASAASVSVGDLITYTYTAQNTGLTGLTGIVAVDDKLGPVALSASLAAGEVTSATLAYVVEESDLPVINNTVTVTATVGVSTVVETRGAAVQVLSNPRISVDKSASAPTAMVGDVVTYTYEVRNTGTVTLHSIELVDDKLGPIGLLTTTLAPGAATTASAVHAVQASELPGPINNTAIVTGTGPTDLVRTAQDGATVAIAYRPGLEVQAFGTPASGVPGTVITYTYVVKNSGDVSLTAIGLTDSRLGAVSLSSTSLAPGAVATGSNTYDCDRAHGQPSGRCELEQHLAGTRRCGHWQQHLCRSSRRSARPADQRGHGHWHVPDKRECTGDGSGHDRRGRSKPGTGIHLLLSAVGAQTVKSPAMPGGAVGRWSPHLAQRHLHAHQSAIWTEGEGFCENLCDPGDRSHRRPGVGRVHVRTAGPNKTGQRQGR